MDHEPTGVQVPCTGNSHMCAYLSMAMDTSLIMHPLTHGHGGVAHEYHPNSAMLRTIMFCAISHVRTLLTF